jgi:hypothetical protein
MVDQHSRTPCAVPANPVRQSRLPSCVSPKSARMIIVTHVADRFM